MKEIEHVAPERRADRRRGPGGERDRVRPLRDGSFGWNINDPGHGFVIANADRPLDAARRGAALGERHLGAAAGHRRRRRRCPAPLRGYLLDLKPGYEDDPTRAVYNHVWLIGDTAALSVDLQAAGRRARRGRPGNVRLRRRDARAPRPGAPESQPDETADDPDSGRRAR